LPRDQVIILLVQANQLVLINTSAESGQVTNPNQVAGAPFGSGENPTTPQQQTLRLLLSLSSSGFLFFVPALRDPFYFVSLKRTPCVLLHCTWDRDENMGRKMGRQKFCIREKNELIYSHIKGTVFFIIKYL